VLKRVTAVNFPPVVVTTILSPAVPTVIGSLPAAAWEAAWLDGENVDGLPVMSAQADAPAGPTPPETDAFTVWPLVETWTF
jgi:hypothetical protein